MIDRFGGACMLVVIALGMATAAAAADGPSEADKRILQGYKLSMDKLKHFGAADRALYTDAARDPALKAEIDKMSEEEPQETVADLTAKLDRHPKVAAYYKKEGLTSQEAVVIPLATMEAMSTLRNKGVGAASPDQLQFAKQHEAEIQALLDQSSAEDDD
jgi:hypothetical protein